MRKPENFRDLGGIPVAGGRKVRAKRLLRSGDVCGLSAKEQNELLAVYDLKTIIDLRTLSEVERYPDDELPGVDNHHIDVMYSAEDKVANLETSEGIANAETAHGHMREVYEAMLTDENAQKGFAGFLRHIAAQEGGSLLFHCFAGKDRTGLGAVYILTVLGADRDAIFKDYLMTNELRRAANRRIADMERKAGASERELEVLDVLVNVQRDYLEHAYEIVDTQYGGMEKYIRDVLGISEAEVGAIREMYTE